MSCSILKQVLGEVVLEQVLLSEESINVHVIKLFYPYTGIRGGSVSTGSVI